MDSFRHALAAALLSSLLAVGAFSQERLVLATDFWSPFRVGDSLENVAGIDVDIVRALEGRLGIPIVIQLHPWPRCMELMRSGEADLMAGIAWSDDRAGYILYLKPSYAVVQPVFIVRSGLASSVSTYADLMGKRIGQSLSTVYFEPYDSDVRLIKVGLSSEEQILRLLALGRIDVAIGTDPNISWDAKRLGLSGFLERAAYAPPAKTELYFGISKKSGAVALADRIERAIADLILDGTIAGIMKKYR